MGAFQACHREVNMVCVMGTCVYGVLTADGWLLVLLEIIVHEAKDK